MVTVGVQSPQLFGKDTSREDDLTPPPLRFRVFQASVIVELGRQCSGGSDVWAEVGGAAHGWFISFFFSKGVAWKGMGDLADFLCHLRTCCVESRAYTVTPPPLPHLRLGLLLIPLSSAAKARMVLRLKK
eukprot:RCo046731